MKDLSALLAGSAGLIIDTNLLVLFVVGQVNPERIQNFKRTNRYRKDDYKLLLTAIDSLSKPLFTVAHVMAEVSNLTDLIGSELQQARVVLRNMLMVVQEVGMSSLDVAGNSCFTSHGLTDAAIAQVARKHNFAVLTDDLDLYLALNRGAIPSLNFAHIRAGAWGI